MRVLVVSARGEALRETLRGLGYAVDVVSNARWARAIASAPYDAIVLDRPGKIAAVRARAPETPLLVLAPGSAHDRIAQLDAGADVSLDTAWDAVELAGRLRTLIRRRYGVLTAAVEVGPITIDLARRIAARRGKPLTLTSCEFQVLEYLAHRRGQVVSAREITDHLYETGAAPTSHIVSAFVGTLRAKLGDRRKTLIATRRHRGYVLEP